MQSLKQKTLLYAEDNLVTQLLYKDFFSNYFKTVYAAKDGQEALNIYHQYQPDVIILDIYMPILSGLEVSKKIREYDHQSKIVLLTARTDKQAMIEAIELGLTAYIEKPVSEKKLQQVLQKTANDFNKSEKITLWYHEKQFFTWDSQNMELFHGNQVISLTKKEKSLLAALLISKQARLNYQQIYDIVWFEKEDENYDENKITALMNSLQAKLPPQAVKEIYGIKLCMD
ncbi:MAG: response regulator transcription factor [Pseudomonadota bacterium]